MVRSTGRVLASPSRGKLVKARTTTAAGLLVALTGTVGVTAPSQADGHIAAAAATRLVVDGLDNPRQLNWTADGQTLIIAEAGVGGDECSDEGCTGATSAVTTVETPWVEGAEAERVIEGLFSAAAPDGSFAIGTTGADGVEAVYPGEFIAVRNALDNPVDTDQGLYFVADSMGEEPEPGTPEHHILPGGDFIFTLADLFEAEAAQNPGGGDVESNPYAVQFVDPTPDVADNDGYALVADAGANTVWKVEPDYDAAVPDWCETGELPEGEVDFADCLVVDVTVFASWPDRGSAEGGDVEFVPTSLAMDDDGNVYVGGLGSEVTGAASVVKFSATGEELEEWGGFTGITGVAVHGDHLYVSELFGAVVPAGPGEGPPPLVVPGDVVRAHMTTGQMRKLEVPFPAGLAVDGDGTVYASVNSVAPAGGIQDIFGPGSLDIGGGAVWALDFDAPQPRATNDSCIAEIPEDGFRDVTAANPFERVIDCLYYWDITRGTSATTYSPGSPVTRGQMAAFIARMVVQAGGSLPEGSDRFADDEGSPYEADINRLAAAGIVNGTGVGTYSPRLLVTRAQMAAFLVRAYNHLAEDAGLDPLSTDIDFFADDEGSTLEASINAAASVGIAAGHADGTYRPREAVRRDHMAAFLMRELDLLVENGITEVP